MISVLVGLLQRNRTERERQTDREIDFKELAHTVAEAWCCQSLQDERAGWRSREEMMLQHEPEESSRGRIPSSLENRRFFSARPLTFRRRPIYIMEGPLLYSKSTD